MNTIIRTFSFNDLRNDETNYFGNQLLKLKDEYNMEELLLSVSFSKLATLNNQLSLSLAKLPVKNATSTINVFKKECITVYNVLFKYIAALKADKDNIYKAEVDLIYVALDANKRPLMRMNNATLLTVLAILFKEFDNSPALMQAIATVNSTGMYERIKQKTQALATEIDNRNTLLGTKSEVTASEAAINVHKACTELFECIQVMQIQNNRDEYAKMITTINVLITDQNNSISHRGGNTDNNTPTAPTPPPAD